MVSISYSKANICMMWLGMYTYNNHHYKLFQIEISLPNSVKPPTGYVASGRNDERGLPIFASGTWSTEIKEVSDEAEKVIQELKNCGGKVMFFRELRRTLMTKSPEHVIPKDEVKEMSI